MSAPAQAVAPPPRADLSRTARERVLTARPPGNGACSSGPCSASQRRNARYFRSGTRGRSAYILGTRVVAAVNRTHCHGLVGEECLHSASSGAARRASPQSTYQECLAPTADRQRCAQLHIQSLCDSSPHPRHRRGPRPAAAPPAARPASITSEVPMSDTPIEIAAYYFPSTTPTRATTPGTARAGPSGS